MFTQEKSTIYTYTTVDGYYYLIKVYDTGIVECFIYHGKVLYPMFMYCYKLSKSRSLNSIIKQVERDAGKYKEQYKTFIGISRIHNIEF